MEKLILDFETVLWAASQNYCDKKKVIVVIKKAHFKINSNCLSH